MEMDAWHHLSVTGTRLIKRQATCQVPPVLVNNSIGAGLTSGPRASVAIEESPHADDRFNIVCKAILFEKHPNCSVKEGRQNMPAMLLHIYSNRVVVCNPRET